MKRNKKIVLDILQKVENGAFLASYLNDCEQELDRLPSDTRETNATSIRYYEYLGHIEMLIDAGYIKGAENIHSIYDLGDQQNPRSCNAEDWSGYRETFEEADLSQAWLTWKGHDLLESLENQLGFLGDPLEHDYIITRHGFEEPDNRR